MVRTYGPDKLTIDQMHSGRQVANDSGHTHYFLGISCKHGHIAPRLVSNSTCVECSRMHYDKHMRPKRERVKQNRIEREKIRKQRQEEKSIKRYGPDKLLPGEMRPNKKEAVEAGHSHYFTGKPCRHSHLAPRQTSNATCTQCARDHSNKYRKEAS